MIYELRIYYTVPGKLPALNDRFANVTLAYFKKYGIQVVGFWTDEVGVSNRLSYIVAFSDMAERDQAWADFRADPERRRPSRRQRRTAPWWPAYRTPSCGPPATPLCSNY